MIPVILLSHGNLARELLQAASTIGGDVEGMAAVALDWGQDRSQIEETVAAAVEEADGGQGVLILTDIFGGTPCNCVLPLVAGGNAEVVTGMNLPMVLRLSLNGDRTDRDLGTLAAWIREKGRESIRLGSERCAGGSSDE